MNKGLLLVLSGPSGSGKGTINQVIAEDPNVFISVSATTRQPREGEQDGKHYYFLSKEEFESRLSTGMILEHNVYCGNYYGTPKKEVYEHLEQGHDVILEIDVNGALKVMKENDVVSIFIMPPSLEVLEQRLRGRGTETEEVVQQRLNEALTEISKAYEYDYIVVNDNLEDAIAQVKAIIVAEKCKTEQNVELIKGVLS
ncbi:MAG: guanylate kinase [Massilioclostridium sp.]|uniref:Guanylate kinase n=2 Tax=Eubacteriales TaxID=186802 RepID=A0ABR7IPQ5_9CLOT|nr:guanylate kinase [Clostridium facile]PWM99340.1 MAG: guanylate kinase [Massilioclostridium sp.]PWN00377.1 MAG: guanylate kinase [Massilioclostridium sp.]